MKKHLTCIDCRQLFPFEAGEQDFFKRRGWSDPIRCPCCRKKHKEAMSDPYYGIESVMARSIGARHRHTRVHYPPHVVGGFR